MLCWDVRNMSGAIFTADRAADTNQKIHFDLDSTGQYLVTGGQDGVVKVFDSKRATAAFAATSTAAGDELPHAYSFVAERDAVNGVSLHPYLALLATSSGQRHFAPRTALSSSSGSESSEDDDEDDGDNDGDDSDGIHGAAAASTGDGGSGGSGGGRRVTSTSNKRQKVFSTSTEIAASCPSSSKPVAREMRVGKGSAGKSGGSTKAKMAAVQNNCVRVWRPCNAR